MTKEVLQNLLEATFKLELSNCVYQSQGREFFVCLQDGTLAKVSVVKIR